MLVSKIYQPRTVKNVSKPKSCLINEKSKEIKTKQLTFAVGAGGVPPEGNDKFPSSFKKTFSAETLKKIRLFTKDKNKLTRKGFDILNKYSNITK